MFNNETLCRINEKTKWHPLKREPSPSDWKKTRNTIINRQSENSFPEHLIPDRSKNIYSRYRHLSWSNGSAGWPKNHLNRRTYNNCNGRGSRSTCLDGPKMVEHLTKENNQKLFPELMARKQNLRESPIMNITYVILFDSSNQSGLTRFANLRCHLCNIFWKL